MIYLKQTWNLKDPGKYLGLILNIYMFFLTKLNIYMLFSRSC